MEININKENTSDYDSILQKIKHKPLIVEYIFSFIKNEPYKFLHLIEKDKILKESINSQFSFVSKNNDFSKEINENIQLIIICKKFQEALRQYNKKEIKKLNKYDYEENGIIGNLDPSILVFESKNFLRFIGVDPSLPKLSMEGLTEIAFYEKEKYEHIQICLLPSTKYKYKDCFYIQKNLNNENKTNDNICSNKEIDVLYCIIDDNEYYLEYIPFINKNIIINEVFFIYIKGLKDINIYHAIEKYLACLNKKNIKRITFGLGFGKLGEKINLEKEFYKYRDNIPIMKMINDTLLNNKKFSFPIPVTLDLSIEQYMNNGLKFYLGIYCLFENKKIEELIEVNSKYYHPNMLEKIENSKGNVLVIRYNGLSSLDDKNFNKFVKKCLNLNIPNIIFYISKETNNNNKAQNNEEIKFNFDKYKNYLFYSEIPTKKLHFDNDLLHFEVTDSNENLILQETKIYKRFDTRIARNYLINHLFLLKKFDNLCFKWKYDENNYYKMYFAKQKSIYNLFILVKNNYYRNNPKSEYIDKEIIIDFEEVINYCKEILNLKINMIKYSDFPLEWKDILKNKSKNKRDSLAKKFLGNKINHKQFLEYELEEDEYYDDEEEEDDYNDDIHEDN